MVIYCPNIDITARRVVFSSQTTGLLHKNVLRNENREKKCNRIKERLEYVYDNLSLSYSMFSKNPF